jgi:hypothetical protein
MKGTWWQASALPWGGREGRRGPAQVAAHGRGQGVGGSPPGGRGDHRRHSIALDSARQQGRDLNKSWWSRGSAVAGAMPLSGAAPHDVAGGAVRAGAAAHGGEAVVGAGPVAIQRLRTGVPDDRAQGGCDHDGVVGIAEDRDEVRYQVEGHGQVGQQQPQPDPDAAGQRAVARQARMNAAGPEGAESPRRRRNRPTPKRSDGCCAHLIRVMPRRPLLESMQERRSDEGPMGSAGMRYEFRVTGRLSRPSPSPSWRKFPPRRRRCASALSRTRRICTDCSCDSRTWVCTW